MCKIYYSTLLNKDIFDKIELKNSGENNGRADRANKKSKARAGYESIRHSKKIQCWNIRCLPVGKWKSTDNDINKNSFRAIARDRREQKDNRLGKGNAYYFRVNQQKKYKKFYELNKILVFPLLICYNPSISLDMKGLEMSKQHGEV